MCEQVNNRDISKGVNKLIHSSDLVPFKLPLLYTFLLNCHYFILHKICPSGFCRRFQFDRLTHSLVRILIFQSQQEDVKHDKPQILEQCLELFGKRAKGVVSLTGEYRK